MMSREKIAAYVPVVTDGYMRFFDRHPDAEIGVLDQSILGRFDYLRKDIRALNPETAALILRGVGRRTRLLGDKALTSFISAPNVYMPRDDVSRELLQDFPDNCVTLEPVFLRWDRDNVNVNIAVTPDRTIELSDDDPVVTALRNEASKSTNWWRQVGAVMLSDGKITATAHNSSMPTPYTSALDGDPRITANRGQGIETSIDIHAEARLIAGLAREGIRTEGMKIAVTTFPCPTCAKLIVESGVDGCYFIEGYAMVDGQQVLEASGVEIVKIVTTDEKLDPLSLKSYPTN